MATGVVGIIHWATIDFADEVYSCPVVAQLRVIFNIGWDRITLCGSVFPLGLEVSGLEHRRQLGDDLLPLPKYPMRHSVGQSLLAAVNWAFANAYGWVLRFFRLIPTPPHSAKPRILTVGAPGVPVPETW